MEHGGERSSDDEPISDDEIDEGDSDSHDEIDGDDDGVFVADLTEETLVLLKQDDPRLIILSVTTATWIKGAGLVIGRNTMLKQLNIFLNRDDSLAELWSGLAHNKSIEWFGLHIQVGVKDVFPMIEPFFRNNLNLRHIEIVAVENRSEPSSVRSLALALKECTSSRLEHFEIFWTDRADDEEFALLFNALQRKTSLLRLAFSIDHLESMGCTALANLLKSPPSKIQMLKLRETRMDSNCIEILCNAIITNKSLQKLDLAETGDLSGSGCVSLSTVLSHPMCSLEDLSLKDNEIGDEGMICLGSALAINKTLRRLDLSNNDEISLAGWEEFSTCLATPHSALKELILERCNIDNEKASVLFSALRENTSLKILNIRENEDFTLRGFFAFFHVLPGSKCAIEELCIPYGLDDEDMEHMWEIVLRALCDTSSIESTYSSNHIFHTCGVFDGMVELYEDEYRILQEEIHTMLSMNKNPNKAEVARKKILKCHFSEGNSGINALACMHETVMPHAFEWMGRDELGYSSMFRFVQSLPMLFDISRGQPAGSKKRKL